MQINTKYRTLMTQKKKKKKMSCVKNRSILNIEPTAHQLFGAYFHPLKNKKSSFFSSAIFIHKNGSYHFVQNPAVVHMVVFFLHFLDLVSFPRINAFVYMVVHTITHTGIWARATADARIYSPFSLSLSFCPSSYFDVLTPFGNK